MIQRFSERLHREDKGFTLIELMVVVLIIAILIAIAIPTFLGARRRAADRAAQSSLRNTVTGAKTIYTDKTDYTNATVSALASDEPALTFVAASAPAGPDSVTVSIDPAATDTFYATAWSPASKTCWYIRDVATSGSTGGTMWGSNVNVAQSTCLASDHAPTGGYRRTP